MSRPVVLPVFHDVDVGSRLLRYCPGTGEVVEARGQCPADVDVESPRAEFRPTGLTVAVAGECELACSYCYGRNYSGPRRWPKGPAVRAAARLVAGACGRSGQPLTACLQGSSEPLANGGQARQVVDWITCEAENQGVATRLAVTTSGVVDSEVLRWAGRTFDSVAISMDGPAEVHDRHRRDRSGRSTWERVDRSLRELTNGLRPESLLIRMTVTADNLATLAEDVDWMARRYRPNAVVVQPAYLIGNEALDAESFAEQLARARHRTRELRVDLVLPSNRFGERHGPFCPPLQDNLFLTPQGRAAWCFAAFDGDAPTVGAYNPQDDRFTLDQERFRELAEAAWTPLETCRDCANVRHCSRGCPDTCALQEPPAPRFCEQVRADLRERLAMALDNGGLLR